MLKFCIDYLHILFYSVPVYVYWGALISIIISFAVLCATQRRKRILRLLGFLLFAEYVFILFCSTIFFRQSESERLINFQPFWSYKAYSDGLTIMLPEHFMNIVVFIPIGILVGFCFRSLKWWEVTAIGMGLSSFIEIMQYTLQKGTCDVDDVIHNTLGCLIGYLFLSQWNKRKIENSWK